MVNHNDIGYEDMGGVIFPVKELLNTEKTNMIVYH